MKLSDDSWPDLDLPPINLYSFAKECSPCVKKCKLVGGVCAGCKRTSDEITEWALMEPLDRYKVILRIEKDK